MTDAIVSVLVHSLVNGVFMCSNMCACVCGWLAVRVSARQVLRDIKEGQRSKKVQEER